MAQVLSNLGVTDALVVYGQDSLDEISMSSPTSVCEVRHGNFESYVITPEDFGFERCDKAELVGGTPQDNALITRSILAGEQGPRRNAVVLNSAAAIHLARPEVSLNQAVKIAEDIIDTGAAQSQLELFVKLSNQ
jgi:anthranilate phosphoribosyltransferase